jgi:hypothetical protein
MSDWSTVTEAVEEFASVEEEFSYLGDNSAKVVLRCPWNKRIDVVNSVLTGIVLYPNASCGAIASRCGVKPVPAKPTAADVNGRIQYDEALVTVMYETSKVGRLDKDEGSGILYSEEIEEIVEGQKLDPKNFCWGTSAGGDRVTDGPVRLQKSIRIRRTLYNLASVPAAFFTLPGYTNAVAYASASLGVTFPIESLLFSPGTVQRTVMSDGTKGWNVPMSLDVRWEGWNKAWNPDKNNGGGNPAGGYDSLYDEKAGAVHKNFPPGDFSTLVF